MKWWRRRELNPRPRTRRRRSTTCVSPFSCRSRLETEPSAPAAIPDMSHDHASGRNVATSLLNDDQSRAVGTLKLIAHWLLSSESVVCVRSYVVFPRDLRGAWASARVPRSRTPVEAKSPPSEVCSTEARRRATGDVDRSPTLNCNRCAQAIVRRERDLG